MSATKEELLEKKNESQRRLILALIAILVLGLVLSAVMFFANRDGAAESPAAPAAPQGVVAADDCSTRFSATTGGSKYNAVYKDGRVYQPNLPSGRKSAFEVDICLNKGTYYFFGVEASLYTASGRAEVGRRENGVEFRVPANGTRYTVVGFASEEGGFSIESNPAALKKNATRFEANFASGGKAQLYDLVIGGESGDWYHQPRLPSFRKAHYVVFPLLPGEYLLDAEECSLSQNGEEITGYGNNLKFTVRHEGKFRVDCNGGNGSGFSIETVKGGPNDK
jgi:hypothetical protein